MGRRSRLRGQSGGRKCQGKKVCRGHRLFGRTGLTVAQHHGRRAATFMLYRSGMREWDYQGKDDKNAEPEIRYVVAGTGLVWLVIIGVAVWSAHRDRQTRSDAAADRRLLLRHPLEIRSRQVNRNFSPPRPLKDTIRPLGDPLLPGFLLASRPDDMEVYPPSLHDPDPVTPDVPTGFPGAEASDDADALSENP
jgi:hypothetical protein